MTRKLLDLSLRNRLLNLPEQEANRSLRFPGIVEDEDEPAAGKKFRGRHQRQRSVRQPDALSGGCSRDRKKVIRNAFDCGQAVVPLTNQDMNNHLLTLYRRSRSDIQEGGANTLFSPQGSSVGKGPRVIPAPAVHRCCCGPGQARAPVGPASMSDRAS